MRNLNKLESRLVGGSDGEPEPVIYPPMQSQQEIERILEALHLLYAGQSAP